MQVAAADEALAFSLAAIQKATAEGARIFAPVEIGEAIENRDTAVEQRDLGAWAEVVSYAGLATEFADKALAISVAQRDRAAEAVVSDAQGSVEGRAPDQPRWSPRAAEDVLVEFERLRTLSASTAQVTFRDLSRLRLNPNSNAIIQRMRSDPLTGGEVTKVSLVNGDFYALLNQLGDRTAFEVAVPGVETATQSADFWVKHDAEGSRFTNYDAARARDHPRRRDDLDRRERGGGAAQRRRDRAHARAGAHRARRPLRRGGALRPRRHPRLAAGGGGGGLLAGGGGRRRLQRHAGLRVGGARHQPPLRRPRGRATTTGASPRSTGSACPGVRSLSWRFRIVDDETPPFVALAAPKEAEVVTTAEVAVSGEAEPGRRGHGQRRLRPGRRQRRLRHHAHPRRGRQQHRGRRRRPGRQPHRADPRLHLRARSAPSASPSTLRCRATPRAACSAPRASSPSPASPTPTPGRRCRVVAADGALAVQALVDAGGGFHFTVPATEAGADYRVEILGPDETVAGAVELAARQDATAAGDRCSSLPPKATANAWLDVAGAAEGAATVTVNGAPGAARRRPLRRRPRASCRARTASRSSRPTRWATSRSSGWRRCTTSTRPRSSPAAATRPGGAAGPIEILVEARDASGLRQAAPYVLSVGGALRRGFLRCDGATGLCRETLPAEPGALALVEVTVEDYAGNAAKRNE